MILRSIHQQVCYLQLQQSIFLVFEISKTLAKFEFFSIILQVERVERNDQSPRSLFLVEEIQQIDAKKSICCKF